jgi:hypothetical protein
MLRDYNASSWAPVFEQRYSLRYTDFRVCVHLIAQYVIQWV